MNRGNKYIVAGLLLGLALTLSSLGYSHRVSYYSPPNQGTITATAGYNDWGYPMPWYVTCNTACAGIITGANILGFFADFVLWVVVSLMAMLAISYARGGRPPRDPSQTAVFRSDESVTDLSL